MFANYEIYIRRVICIRRQMIKTMSLFRRCKIAVWSSPYLSTSVKSFSTMRTPLIKAHKMPPRPKINENDITEVFLKGGQGPGGQKINKCNSKVQLKHLPTGIVVSCQATRSRDQNRKKAREILAMKVQHLLDPENSRQSALEQRKLQQSNSKEKKAKKKYKVLDLIRKEKKEQELREEMELLRSLNMIKPE